MMLSEGKHIQKRRISIVSFGDLHELESSMQKKEIGEVLKKVSSLNNEME